MVTRYDYDAGGRLVQVVENERLTQPADVQTTVTTQFGYDATGHLLSITDARGNTQTFASDLLGRQIRASDPLSHTQQLFYTPRGELDYTIDPMGRTIDYRYDALGRLITTAWARRSMAMMHWAA